MSPTKRRKVGEISAAPPPTPAAAILPRPKNEVTAFFEAEILAEDSYHHFSTFGAFADLGEFNARTKANVRFFASMIPDRLVKWWGELSPATQAILTQRLRLEFSRVPVKFRHQGRGIVPALSERQGLLNLVTWLRGLGQPVRLFVHAREGRTLPVLVGKLKQYNLYADFARTVVGVCDVASLGWNRGFISQWIGGERNTREAPNSGIMAAEGAASVEAEESDELAELMGQMVNQVRETGTETEKRDFLVQVRACY